jgi:hypothetical protein
MRIRRVEKSETSRATLDHKHETYFVRHCVVWWLFPVYLVIEKEKERKTTQAVRHGENHSPH